MRTLLVSCAVALLPAASLAAAPPEGVVPQVRRGFFVETDVGMFFTLGGVDGYSNAQTYLQLGLGYDLADRFSLGGHFGLGSNAANCFGGRTPAGACVGSENFTVFFLDASAAYLLPIADRVYLTPKLLVGFTLMDPSPTEGAAGSMSGPNVGVGLGVEYATFMDHFSIGADVSVRLVVGPNIPAVAIFPRVKYTF
ncbi:MAG: adventurous gliding motility protein CglE [Myxococcaceae bacterium]|nr:adventurous gliding motility protein CglE [Myxococcaceae bacterium]MCI0670004.1 adventurous gliding motility protein CglE [Myxococcaceae bacterium]